jgi:hypothetical protein
MKIAAGGGVIFDGAKFGAFFAPNVVEGSASAFLGSLIYSNQQGPDQ